MVLSSFISSILILSIGIWAYFKLETTMTLFAERQLLIEPSKFSYKMWKDMPVSMYQSFTFFNLTNWNQVKSVGQKPRFVEVGPYVYKTYWTKSEIQFLDSDSLVSFSEKKQWHFQAHLSRGYEDDQIWTINTPLMTALALIQNAPVITRNIVSVILDGLGEGAFIRRPIRSLLFEGYSDLIVSVGPLFDRRFSNFNGKFAYLYNKNDSIDGTWTVSTGTQDLSQLNRINRFQSTIYNISSSSSGLPPQGLNEVKSECASAWGLDQATNGQLFAPFNEARFRSELAAEQEARRQAAAAAAAAATSNQTQQQQHHHSSQFHQQPAIQPQLSSISSKTRNFFSRSVQTTPATSHQQPTNNNHDNHYHHHNHRDHHHNHHQADPLVPSSSSNHYQQQQLNSNQNYLSSASRQITNQQQQQLQSKPEVGSKPADLASQQASTTLYPDLSKFIFYPDLCRPLHLLANSQEIVTANGIRAHRYTIDPRIFMNSTQQPANKCFEMNPRPPLANALAATINSVTGANVAMPSLVTGAASSPIFSSIFSPISGASGGGSASLQGAGPLTSHLLHNHHNHHHHHHQHNAGDAGGGGGGVGGSNAGSGGGLVGGLGAGLGGSIFERANHPSSFLNNALSTLAGASSNGISSLAHSSSHLSPSDPNGAINQNGPLARLSRVRQLFTNIVSQRMSGGSGGGLLQGSSLLGGGGGHGHYSNAANHQQSNSNARRDDATPTSSFAGQNSLLRRHPFGGGFGGEARQAAGPTSANHDPIVASSSQLQAVTSAGQPPAEGAGQSTASNGQIIGSSSATSGGDDPTGSQQQQAVAQPAPPPPAPTPTTTATIATGSSHSDRWITQFRFKWPRGVFSIGQCQLGAPIYASLPHFLDADEYYLDQVDGLRPNRSLHEFYIDIESSLHSIPVNAKARLQLNVATPELRFRNIPNAMIPVLWQEVTFEIDKPVASMLYWSFTMSGRLYTIASILIIICGLLPLFSSLIKAIKRQRLQRHQSKRQTGIDEQTPSIDDEPRSLSSSPSTTTTRSSSLTGVEPTTTTSANNRKQKPNRKWTSKQQQQQQQRRAATNKKYQQDRKSADSDRNAAEPADTCDEYYATRPSTMAPRQFMASQQAAIAAASVGLRKQQLIASAAAPTIIVDNCSHVYDSNAHIVASCCRHQHHHQCLNGCIISGGGAGSQHSHSSRVSLEEVSCDTLSELRHGAAINRAFFISSANSTSASNATSIDNLNNLTTHNNHNDHHNHHSITTQVSEISAISATQTTTTTTNKSPISMTTSRTHSDCELDKQQQQRKAALDAASADGDIKNSDISTSKTTEVAQLPTQEASNIETTQCSGKACLLACLRHSPAAAPSNHQHIPPVT